MGSVGLTRSAGNEDGKKSRFCAEKPMVCKKNQSLMCVMAQLCTVTIF